MKILDENYSAKKPYGNYVHVGTGPLRYKRGNYFSPNGIISVYAQKARPGEDKSNSIIRLDFVYNGRVHYRTIRGVTTISDQALSIRANQFVKSVIL